MAPVYFGIPDALGRFIPYYTGKKDFNKVKSLVFTLYVIMLLLSLSLVTISLLFSKNIIDFYGHGIESIFILSIVLSVFHLWWSVITLTLWGLKEFTILNSINSFQNILKLILAMIVLYYFIGNAVNILIVFILSLFIAILFDLYFIFKKLDNLPGKFSFLDIKEIKQIAKFSIPAHLSHIIANLSDWVPTLFIGYYMSTNNVAAYSSMFLVASSMSLFLINPLVS